MNYTSIMLLLCLPLYAQTIIPLEQQSNYTSSQDGYNYYYKDVNGILNKYVGKWKYQKDTEVIEISIFKDTNHNFGNYHKDQLYIKFKYTKNGLVIINTLNTGNNNYLISGGRFKNADSINQIHLLYIEPGQTEGNRQWLNLEYQQTLTGPKLHWTAKYEVLTSVTVPPKMPLDMVFTKQN